MHRMMRPALGATAEFDHATHERMLQFVQDPDPGARDASTLTACYLALPEMRGVLAELAAHDPEPQVRQDAANALGRFDSSGVPG